MNLYFRLLLKLLLTRWQQRIDTSETTTARFRVWPQDVDVFGHMNNGRYLQIMDIARSSWMARCGALGVMRENKWGAALGGGSIRFRKALKPFQRYRVTTRLISWDSRWFYLEHGFLDEADRCIAVGVSRAAIRSHKGWVRTGDVMALVDPQAKPAVVPDYLRDLGDAETAMQQAYTKRQLPPEDDSRPPRRLTGKPDCDTDTGPSLMLRHGGAR